MPKPRRVSRRAVLVRPEAPQRKAFQDRQQLIAPSMEQRLKLLRSAQRSPCRHESTTSRDDFADSLGDVASIARSAGIAKEVWRKRSRR